MLKDWQNIPSAAAWLHSMGANVLFVAHHEQPKKPMHRWAKYQTERQTRDDFNEILGIARWVVKKGGLAGIPAYGIINGINGWHTMDFDKADKSSIVEFLALAGLPDDYPWVSLSGSGCGYGIVFLCFDEPTPALPAGNPWFLPRDGRPFEHVELRWKHGQTILPASTHPSGNRYQWLHSPPTEAPAVLSWDDVDRALTVQAMPKVTHVAHTPTRQTYIRHGDRVIDDIKGRLDMLALAQRLFKGALQQEGDETRILGHGGLHINVGKGVFNSLRDGEQGVRGDAIDLIGLYLFGSGWDRRNGVKFYAALNVAAREVGVELEARR